MANAPTAPIAASTPQTIDQGVGRRLAAIVPSTAVVAHTNHPRRGRTGGGTPCGDAMAITRVEAKLAGPMDELMRDYYEQRAWEYDDWWLGTGLFAQARAPGLGGGGRAS